MQVLGDGGQGDVGDRAVEGAEKGALARTRSSFSSEDEVAITLAPIARTNCKAKIDTPPVPSTSTASPALRPPSTTSARQAVSPAVVKVAASSCE